MDDIVIREIRWYPSVRSSIRKGIRDYEDQVKSLFASSSSLGWKIKSISPLASGDPVGRIIPVRVLLSGTCQVDRLVQEGIKITGKRYTVSKFTRH
jgi:hypothetical protein